MWSNKSAAMNNMLLNNPSSGHFSTTHFSMNLRKQNSFVVNYSYKENKII